MFHRLMNSFPSVITTRILLRRIKFRSCVVVEGDSGQSTTVFCGSIALLGFSCVVMGGQLYMLPLSESGGEFPFTVSKMDAM